MYIFNVNLIEQYEINEIKYLHVSITQLQYY